MKRIKPTITKTMQALLEADIAVQKSNYRSLLLVLLIPLVLLFAWHKGRFVYGPSFLVAIAMTVTLLGVGLTSYPISIARDRDLGIFQRLRVTPTPVWAIMVSKIIIQIALCIVALIVVIIGSTVIYNIHFDFINYLLLLGVTLIAAAMYLSIGQTIVGLVKSMDTVNAVSRFVYIPTFLIGMIGELGILGSTVQNIVQWSPFGTVERLLICSITPSTWNGTALLALLVTIGYAIVFATIGIRLFQWDSK